MRKKFFNTLFKVKKAGIKNIEIYKGGLKITYSKYNLTDKRGIIHSGESYSEIIMHHWNTVNNKIIDITPLIPPFEEYGQKIIKKEYINKNKIDSEKLIKLYKL